MVCDETVMVVAVESIDSSVLVALYVMVLMLLAAPFLYYSCLAFALAVAVVGLVCTFLVLVRMWWLGVCVAHLPHVLSSVWLSTVALLVHSWCSLES